MEWTEETIARLRALWDEGLSTAEIGRQLSITKNAVVGKAHRLGLPSRPSPIRRASHSKEASSEEKTEANKTAKKTSAKKENVSPKIEKKKAVTSPSEKTNAKEVHEVAEKEKKAPSVSAVVQTTEPVKVKEPAPKKAEIRKSAIPLVKKQKDVVLQFTRKASNCCWPIGDPGTKGFHFCGAEAIPGKPYCVEHAQIAYVKLRDRSG